MHDQSQQVRQEKEASFTDFLLYFSFLAPVLQSQQCHFRRSGGAFSCIESTPFRGS